jgi:superfamily II RNA helicase
MNTLSILDTKYYTTDRNLLKEFKKIAPKFELDDFQKHSVEKIRNNENILVTVNTGGGKSKCMEYAIYKSLQSNKKCIITTPIKALSNQKFYEFKKKFKGVATIGIMTGDIKFNPSADVLIMTQEILRNLLYKKQYDYNKIQYKLDLDINLETDVDCVVMDEVHFINLEDRGKVWEESLVLLPPHINLVLLSATINNADQFALWLQNIKQKPCHLIPKKERVIPLTHYMYYTTRHPKKADIETSNFIHKYSNELVELVSSKKVFNENNYHIIRKIKNIDDKIKNSFTNKKVIINNLIKFLKQKKLLPALFFVFSRKKCEEYAHSVEVCLNNKKEQSKVEKIIQNSIHQLHNKEMYLNSNEYLELKTLLMKGIAYHHSGLRTVFKEIIELLCNEGLVKVLFATETFAVGINAPIKTVVFSSLQKYSNDGLRYINTSEYLQMAGRAGRRGLDKVGTVILLANSMELPVAQEIKGIMCGSTANIQSKFSLGYQFILKILLNDHISFDKFLKNTLLNNESETQKEYLISSIKQQEHRILQLTQTRISSKDYDRYYIALEKKNNKQKLTNGEKNLIKKLEANPIFVEDYQLYLENFDEINYLNKLQYDLENWIDNTDENIKIILKFLEDMKYIQMDGITDISKLTKNNVTLKGIIASQLNECNELLMTEMLTCGYFDDLNEAEICGMLGIFLHTKCLTDNMSVYNAEELDISNKLKFKLKHLDNLKNQLEEKEINAGIYTDCEWELNYDMVEYSYKFCNGIKFKDLYFDNYIGSFVKDMLKLDNIICTLEVLAIISNNNILFYKLQNIHSLILRDEVSTESLYIKL